MSSVASCVLPIQFLNEQTDFHESWYEGSKLVVAYVVYNNSVLYIFARKPYNECIASRSVCLVFAHAVLVRKFWTSEL
jgi:uncharacterized membrane protein (GlpM family)